LKIQSRKYPAVVLAGGRAKSEIIAATGVENRALIPVHGRTMLEAVVEALRDAPSVGEVIVVGNVPDSADYRRVPDQGGYVENVFAGLHATGEAEYALIATSDVPFVHGAVVEDFVARGAALGADMIYPIVPVEACYARFPGVRRTSLSLREGRFTGGNMALVRPAFMEAQRERIARAYAARKSVVRLALMLGIGTTLRVAATLLGVPGLLTIPRLEVAASRLLGGTARALVSNYPEIATDIDRPDDLAAVRNGARE